MAQNELLREISFDLYERYILLEQIAKLFSQTGSAYRVLDVGGHTPVFCPGFSSLAAALIPDAKVTIVDLQPATGLENYAQASGLALPFGDSSFDLVCSLDTLEHIPAAHRPAFLAELLRVTRDGLYLAFPFDSASNRWAESLVVAYTEMVLRDPVPALLEHRQFGLPDRDGISKAFAGWPYSWIEFAQGNTDVWLLMMLTYHSLRTPGTDFVAELNRRFNQAYAAHDWAEPYYRAGYLLSKTRSAQELEALRPSFTARTSADLAGILSLCQLFLTIAHNARVTVDKDRHIRNIESELAAARAGMAATAAELAAARADLEKPDETAAALCQLESLLRDSERARQQAEIEHSAALARQLDLIREQIGGLERQFHTRMDRSINQLKTRLASGQARLDTRMRDLELGLVTNKRAIQSVYDSRIWKTLSTIGGLILRVTGRGSELTRGVPQARSGSAGRAAQPANAAQEFVGLVCDYPGETSIEPVRDVVEVRGWALADSGIDRVFVQIGNQPPVTATYGIARPDVARSYPQIRDAEHAGFRFFWDTSGLPEGLCTVKVKALNRSGASRETVCKVSIDRNTSPGYAHWIARNEPGHEDLDELRREAASFALRPTISIAVPVYKTPIPILGSCVDSVRAQTYNNWELCLADDGSGDAHLAEVLHGYAQADPRIRMVTLPHNRGISAATNEALSLCTGDYIGFLDHDDELAAFALSEVVRAINAHPDTELFYSDEDKIDEQGHRYDAFFKPDWSPDLFLSYNYICHFVVMKHSLLDCVGGLDVSYNGAQDYDLLLRASEHTGKIRRLPKVLYHWRAVSGSAAKAPDEKPAASGDGERALASYLGRTAPGAHVEQLGACRYRVRYPIEGEPRVSILIPTAGYKGLYRAVDEVLAKTSYPNYEIVLIDNSTSQRVAEAAARWAGRKAPVRHLDWRGRPFNFARMNNEAVRSVDSPYVLFLNDDTSIITGEWLSAMLEHAHRPEVGAVGAQLWYPNGLIQHAGVVMGLYGNCSHAFKNLPGGASYYFDLPNLIRDCSAVTAACMLIAKDKFLKAGCFDEINLAVAFQDVDLCLKLLELGLRNVYTPYARLYHYESATKTEEEKIPDPVEDAFMKKKWAKYIADDPYYNPNLTRRKEDFSLALD